MNYTSVIYLETMVCISNHLSATWVHKDVRMSAFSLLGELDPEEILPLFSPQKLIESSVKSTGTFKSDLLWLLHFSNIYLQSTTPTCPRAGRAH